MRTALHEGRIYFKRGGVFVDPFFVFQADGSKYPNTTANDALLKKCVNSPDPSTASPSYLGAVTPEGIYCNGKLITDRLFLGSYNDGGTPVVFTNLYAHVNSQLGILRITAHRDVPGNTNTYSGFNGSLMDPIIRGENGSYANPSLGFTNISIVKGCFYDDLPKYPEANPTPACTTNPTIGTISNITQTGLTFNYSGSGVSSIKWRIKRSDNGEAASGTSSTTSTNITYATLPAGNYTLEIEGNNCTSLTNTKSFTVTAPVVGLPNCINGPAISNISSITPSTANITFTGDNLTVFSWRILSGTTVMGYGKTAPLSSKTASIEYPYLAAGTYTFEMTAEDCRGTTRPTRNFTIASTTDTRSICDRGPTLGSIPNSGEEALTFQFDGNGVYAIDWKILQGGTVIRQNRVRPTSSTPTIDYTTLPTGTYTLQIAGGSCISASGTTAKTFAVNTSLPIYIANFKGNTTTSGVELSWEVVSEKDGAGFEIIRFGDQAKSEEVIGKVMLTDRRVGTYKFNDEAPLLGTNYYQLRQIDVDGSSTKSKIISVTPSVISGTVVAPNPATDYVNVQFSSRTAGTADVAIYNISGIKVSGSKIQVSEGKNSHRIQIGKLAIGNYILKVSHAGDSSKLRFIKGH